MLLTQSSQIRWLTFYPIVLSRQMKNGPSAQLLECSGVLETPAATAAPATLLVFPCWPVAVKASVLTYCHWDQVRDSNLSLKFLSCVNSTVNRLI